MSGAIPPIPHMPSWHAEGLRASLFTLQVRVLWSFRREADENCALLGHYAAYSGNSLSSFRDTPSLPSSEVFLDSWHLNMGPIGCTKTSIRKYHYSLHNSPEERSSQLLYTMENDMKYDCSYFHFFRYTSTVQTDRGNLINHSGYSKLNTSIHKELELD